jgi:hypothetical protein
MSEKTLIKSINLKFSKWNIFSPINPQIFHEEENLLGTGFLCLKYWLYRFSIPIKPVATVSKTAYDPLSPK